MVSHNKSTLPPSLRVTTTMDAETVQFMILMNEEMTLIELEEEGDLQMLASRVTV